MLRTARLLPLFQGSRRWASTPGVTPRRRQPATRLPGDYLDGTCTRWRRRACGHPRSGHRAHRPPIPSHVSSGHAVHTPPPDHRIQGMYQLFQGYRNAATGQRPHLVLEPIDGPLSGNRVQADTALLEAQPLTQPDLVAQELEPLADVHDSGLLRMNPQTQLVFEHRAGARQRPLRFLASPADRQPIVSVPGKLDPRPLHLLVEDVQIDIAEQRADDAALWRTSDRAFIDAVSQHSGREYLTYQTQH